LRFLPKDGNISCLRTSASVLLQAKRRETTEGADNNNNASNLGKKSNNKKKGIMGGIFKRNQINEAGEKSSSSDELVAGVFPINATDRIGLIDDKLTEQAVHDIVDELDKEIAPSEISGFANLNDKVATNGQNSTSIPANVHLVGMSLNDSAATMSDRTDSELDDDSMLADLDGDGQDDAIPAGDSVKKRSWFLRRKKAHNPTLEEEEKEVSPEETEPHLIALSSTSKASEDATESPMPSTSSATPIEVQKKTEIVSIVDGNKKNSNIITMILSRLSPFGVKGFTRYLTVATLLFLFAPVPKQFTMRSSSGQKFSPGMQSRYHASIPFIEPGYQPRHSQDDNNGFDGPPSYSRQSETGGIGENEEGGDAQQESSPREVVVAQRDDGRTGSNGFEEDRKRASTSVAAAVRKVGPSVVRIDTKRFIGAGQGRFSTPYGGLFDDLEEHEENGQGSGIIFSEKGMILTNAHVVSRADEVMVTLTDGRRYKAEVKGTDELTDLAVLQMKTFSDAKEHSEQSKTTQQDGRWEDEPLPVATFGNSDTVEVGEWVIAVGNPVGLDNTVTMGIVSALKRSSEEVGIPNKKVPFIQTDAAINPGNSGGPLVNGNGEIIGINTCIRANAEGIGFAIPINKAKKIIDRLAQGQPIQHGFVGMNVISITPDLARQQNADPNSPAGMIPEVYGAMITMVRSNAPAANCGLRRFDIVLEIGGNQIKNAGDVIKVFDEAPVGKEIGVRVLRNNREIVISVVPDDLTEKLLEARQSQQKQEPRGQEFPRQGGGHGEGIPGQPRIFILPFQ